MGAHASEDVELNLIRKIAAKLLRPLPRTVELADLISDGFIGLTRARQRYDPGRGVPFEGFAATWIRGAMLDGIRARDWLPTRMRRRSRRAPTPRVHSLVSPPQDEPQIERRVQRLDWIAHCLKSMPRTIRLIVYLYHFEGMQLSDIGRCLGMTQAWVSVLRARTIEQLRAAHEHERPGSVQTSRSSVESRPGGARETPRAGERRGV